VKILVWLERINEAKEMMKKILEFISFSDKFYLEALLVTSEGHV